MLTDGGDEIWHTVEIWKRFRKWGGVPTGITQNVKDLLSSREVLFKRRVYRHAQKIAVGELVVTAAPFVVAQPVFLRILHHGQPVLGADQVGQPADGAVAADEVLELPRTVQRRGVPVEG